MGHSIDINCDMGESYAHKAAGLDEAILPSVTSCSIACGFHSGDPVLIERTIALAIRYDVQIGAHPSYPDRENFGRKPMELPTNELAAYVRYQLAAMSGMTRAMKAEMAYVKPHGALYNRASEDAEVAGAIARAILSLGRTLPIMGPGGSELEHVARKSGLPFVAEAFADRRYRDGRLISRSDVNAVITDPNEAALQAVSIVLEKKVISPEGAHIPVESRSICVHGDNPSVIEILSAIDREFKANHITRQAFVA